jgi:heat shock protein HtpX
VRLHAARNIAKTAVLLGAFMAALTALGWWLGGWGPGALGLFVGLLLAATLVLFGDRVVLGMTHAKEEPEGVMSGVAVEAARIARLAGVPPPKLAVIDDLHPRLFTVGRGPGSATLVVSHGLSGVASGPELEGLLAHEVAHVSHRDVLPQTVLAVVAAGLLEASRIGGFLQRALLFLLAPLAASLVHLVLSPRRELAADRTAAALTSPAAVADGLARLDQAMALVDFAASPATEPLYPLHPFTGDRLGSMFQTHPPTEARLRALRGDAERERPAA